MIRNLVWSHLHQQHYSIDFTEIDVVYFEIKHQSSREQQRLAQALTQYFPNNQWDVVNQADVHHWYKNEQGQSISPFCSLHDALAGWPETATAVAVRLVDQDEVSDPVLDIVAPFGLNDLMHLTLRWNPALVSHHTFMSRLTSKRFLQRWPHLILTQPNDDDGGVETTMQ